MAVSSNYNSNNTKLLIASNNSVFRNTLIAFPCRYSDDFCQERYSVNIMTSLLEIINGIGSGHIRAVKGMLVSINEYETKVQPQITALKVALLTRNLKQVSSSH